MIFSRRGLLGGLLGILAAPAIVRAESLMKLPPPKRIITGLTTPSEVYPGWLLCDGSIISREKYPELMMALGSGATAQALPDFRGRDPKLIGRRPVNGMTIEFAINTRSENGHLAGTIRSFAKYAVPAG